MTVRRLESVPRPRYFRFCNVLHIWTIRAIPTYRVYRLYDIASILSESRKVRLALGHLQGMIFTSIKWVSAASDPQVQQECLHAILCHKGCERSGVL